MLHIYIYDISRLRVKVLARNRGCHGKGVSIACARGCLCVFVALVTQHAERMRLFIISSVSPTALHHFSTLSHERHDFWGKQILLSIQYMFLFSLQRLFGAFFHYKKK